MPAVKAYTIAVDPTGEEICIVATSEKEALAAAWAGLSHDARDCVASLEVVEVEETTGHTPGPWRCEMHRGCKTIYGNVTEQEKLQGDDGGIATVSGTEIGFTHGNASEHRDRCNANLIAAAPALLAACERSLKFVADLESPAEVAAQLREAIHQAKEPA